jgi:malonate decarboxylase beta subunit
LVDREARTSDGFDTATAAIRDASPESYSWLSRPAVQRWRPSTRAMPATPFSRLTAVERAAALTDPGTLELLPADAGQRSTVLAARGRIEGCDSVLLLTDGQQRGGTIGLVEAHQFSHALRTAERRRTAVVVCWDTGGVRVQEGPAALAATSAVGVALTRLALRGTPVVAVISGPRGCFGAPAVVAATGRATIMTRDAVWGLTGPALLDTPRGSAAAARRVMSAGARLRRGHATELAANTAAAIRRAVARALSRPLEYTSARRLIDRCVATTDRLITQLPNARRTDGRADRRRDFLAYSFRGHWQQRGASIRRAHVDAAWGRFSGNPAMAIIIGPQRTREGFGVADANAVLHAVRIAAASSRGAPAPIIIFLFCRGHATTLVDERAGLPRALAETLRGLMAARLRGHPLLCVLGGGAYGAAYLAVAAPSHRVLAIRGTAVAPMAPRVLAAFQQLSGVRAASATPPDLSRLIPEIRMVESVVRLPRVLDEELAVARSAAAAQPALRRLAVR